MRFKDLPPHKKVLELSTYYHGGADLSDYVFLHHGDFSSFGNVRKAYTHLKKHRGLKVSDAFYGNSFPILHGWTHYLNHNGKHMSHVIIKLNKKNFPYSVETMRAANDFCFDSSLTYSLTNDFDDFLRDSIDKGLYVSSIAMSGSLRSRAQHRSWSGTKVFFFATNTHEEIVERLVCAHVTTI